MGALPPMHELARQVGLELPEFLGRFGSDQQDHAASPPPKPAPPTPPPIRK